MRETATRNLSTGPARLALALVAALAGGGCGEVDGVAVAPSTEFGLFVEVRPRLPLEVDLLFVIDDSGSMAEEQAVLAGYVEAMVCELVAPEPDPETGAMPRAVDALHVGVGSPAASALRAVRAARPWPPACRAGTCPRRASVPGESSGSRPSQSPRGRARPP